MHSCSIAKSCLTPCNHMDCSPTCPSVHGKPRILEWIAISSSRGSSQLRASTWEAHIYCGGGLVTKSCLTLVTQWSVACHAPLSIGFSMLEYKNVLPFPSLGDCLDPGIKPESPALQADSLPTELQGKLHSVIHYDVIHNVLGRPKSLFQFFTPVSRKTRMNFLANPIVEGFTL